MNISQFVFFWQRFRFVVARSSPSTKLLYVGPG